MAEENARNLQNELNRKKSEIDTLTQQKNDLSGQLTQATQNHQLEKTRLENEVKRVNLEKNQALSDKATAERNVQKAVENLVAKEQELTELKSKFNISNGKINIGPRAITANGIRSNGEKVKKTNYRETLHTPSFVVSEYVYNLEQAGYFVKESGQGGNIAVEYGGNLTESDQLKKLSGQAIYQGRTRTVYSKQMNDGSNRRIAGTFDEMNMIKLTVDFDQRTIHGYIYGKANSDEINGEPPYIVLEPANIYSTGNPYSQIFFEGKASTKWYSNVYFSRSYSGKYEGKFMGGKAEQLAGKFEIQKSGVSGAYENDPIKSTKISGAFAAEQQK